ncbi:hypothetical protein B0F90DRAFT_1790999 [Multifurca ochricompacta]|uniref:Uncharacterized protein n=1 Tax=Multifurca ochricompacta TaxID=376703 RepID=A0AAD4QIQ7_9AGAM|nr:hypothetical protein B0F90DRAFT_1790999 [Multifurca ochricompacta]
MDGLHFIHLSPTGTLPVGCDVRSPFSGVLSSDRAGCVQIGIASPTYVPRVQRDRSF